MGNEICCPTKDILEIKTTPVSPIVTQQSSPRICQNDKPNEDAIEDLTFSAVTNNVAVVSFILKYKNISVNSSLLIQPPDRTLLHVAAEQKYQNLMDFIFQNYKKAINIDAQDKKG